MKKIFKFLLVIMFALVSTNIVSAKTDLFEMVWNKGTEIKSVEDLFISNKTEYKNGYIITQMLYSNEQPLGTKISYYDYNGNLIVEKNLNNQMVLSLRELDGNLYSVILKLEENTDNMYFSKLDSELNILVEKNITGNGYYYEQFLYMAMVKYVGYDLISNINNEITVIGSQNDDLALYHFDKDLNNVKIDVLINEQESYEKAAEYYPVVADVLQVIEEISNSNVPDKVNLLAESKNGFKVYNGADLSKCEILDRLIETNDFDSDNIPSCYVNSNLRLTKDNNTIFDKNYNEYLALINSKIIGNYIVAIGVTNVGDIKNVVENIRNNDLSDITNIRTEIVIINMTGEIVATIGEKNAFYLGINTSSKGFTVNKLEADLNSIINTKSLLNALVSGTESNNQIKLSVEVYEALREVNTIVKGKGSVSAVNKSKTGEEVTFNVTPEKGYNLSLIKITDEFGNTIETKDNTFIMPSSNVTIEVIFESENPETADIAIVGISFILLIGLALTFINYSKMKSLR